MAPAVSGSHLEAPGDPGLRPAAIRPPARSLADGEARARLGLPGFAEAEMLRTRLTKSAARVGRKTPRKCAEFLLARSRQACGARENPCGAPKGDARLFAKPRTNTGCAFRRSVPSFSVMGKSDGLGNPARCRARCDCALRLILRDAASKSAVADLDLDNAHFG